VVGRKCGLRGVSKREKGHMDRTSGFESLESFSVRGEKPEKSFGG